MSHPVNQVSPADPAEIERRSPAAEPDEQPPQLWGWHTLLSGVITLVLFGVLAWNVDWPGAWRAARDCNISFVLLGTACHYLTYPIRGVRWRCSLSQLPIRGGERRFGLVVFFYNFVDNLVPAKLGDLYAAHLARINFGIRRSAAIGSIALLRMLDAWTVLALAFLSSWFLMSGGWTESVRWTLTGGAVIAVATTTLLITFRFLGRGLPRWMPERFRPMIDAFGQGMWPERRQRIPILLLGGAIWLLEILWIYFLLRGFHVTPSLVELLFISTIPLLASAFPFTPAGAGFVEVTLYHCLTITGAPSGLAGSITVMNRLIDYWLHIASGAVIWALRRQLGLRTWREEPGSVDVAVRSSGQTSDSTSHVGLEEVVAVEHLHDQQ